MENILALVVCILPVLHAMQDVATTEHYDNSLTLDTEGNYLLYWNYNSTHVTFEVRVKTRGYVGFGLSRNGNMFPADVVVGWVNDGKDFFTDRHTTGHTPPTVDKSQDWFLLHGEENDFGTLLKFVRKINTCDQDDFEINKATKRVIYSYHPDDPADEDSIMYHGGERRGTKSVALLNVNKPPEVVASEEIKIYDFTAGNFLVPDKDTTYLCVGHQMPDLGTKHHLIQFEPIFTQGNERLIHHMVIQRCAGKHPLLHGARAECLFHWPLGWPRCSEEFVGWAAGGGPFYFPPSTGFPVSGPGDYSFMVMRIHYNNPSFKSGIIDNSGIRMRLTSTLLQHDAGTLIIGHNVIPYHVVPPHEPAFVTSGYCAEKCLNRGMDQKQITEIRAVAVLHHAHRLATRVQTRHFRNGTELPPILDDPNYNFYFQEFRLLQDEVVIKKGDSIKVECTYTTTKRSDLAFGGFSTRDEMCKSVMFYYPKMDVVSCLSFPNMGKLYNYNFNVSFEGGPGSVQEFVTNHYDWSNSTERETFKHQLEEASNIHVCSFNSHNERNPFGHEVWDAEEHESDHVTYVPPPSHCDSKN